MGVEVRDVDVVARAQRGQHVVAALVDRGAAAARARATWKSRSFTGPGGTKRLVDEDVDRIGMIDGDELHLVGVRGLPELLGELEDVASVARLQRVARDAQVFLRRARRSEALVPLPMRPSGMPSALRHIASVTKRKRLPSHVYAKAHDPLSISCSTTSWSVPGKNTVCGTPFGHSMRSTSALRCGPSPKCVTRPVATRVW